MTLDWAVGIILLGFGALGLYFRTYIKSTVSESIKHQFETERLKMREEFERELHKVDRKDKYKIAAMDKRLASHQEAYKIARLLLFTIHDSEQNRYEAQKKFTEFWDNNCLYLTNDARIALQNSAVYHSEYKIFWSIWNSNPKNQEAIEDLNIRFETISKTPDLIMRAIDEETLTVEPKTPEGMRITATEIETKKQIKKIRK